MPKILRAADLFCGAGGTTTGAEQSGKVKVELAVNHWTTAITTHRNNHPHVRHVCAPIDLVDPRDFAGMGLNVVMASPECIFHSNARGGKPVDDQRRATAWCVPRWAEVLRPKWLIIENVREFEDWGPLGSNNRPMVSKKGEIFEAWINALRALNYHVEWKLLNAADFGGATKRIRLFIVARLGHSKKPIPWPSITHPKEAWTPAAAIIDWARSLRDQCQAAGVPFFFKQWGEWLPPLQDGARTEDGQVLNCSDEPERVGKKAAGRLLDGREWNEFPLEVAHA